MRTLFALLLFAAPALAAQTDKVTLSYSSENFDSYVTVISSGHVIEPRFNLNGHAEWPLNDWDGAYLARVLGDAYPDTYVITTDGQSLFAADSDFGAPSGWVPTAVAFDSRWLGGERYELDTYFVGIVPEPSCLWLFVPLAWFVKR